MPPSAPRRHVARRVAGRHRRCVGSGKTTVLSRRIAYRVASGVADSRHVLALTFPRQAAVEMRSPRCASRLRDDVSAGTFHAVAPGEPPSGQAANDHPIAGGRLSVEVA